MATLVIVEGPAAGHHFDLGEHNLVMIGRDEECTFQVLDEAVSRRHLQVKYDSQEDRHYAIDVGSSNGVHLNGTKLEERQRHPLDDGDAMLIGKSRIVYTRENYPDAEQAMRGVRQIGERRRSTIFPKQ